MEPKKPISHFAAGAILGAIIIVYSLAIYFAKLPQSGGIGWLSYLVFIVVLAVLVNLYGKSNNYQVSFGNLFAFGFKSTAFATVLILFFVVTSFLALPEIKERMLEESRKAMEKQNKSDEEIEEGIKMIEKFVWLGIIGGTILIYIILGAIGSLIGAAITKKRPYNPLEQLDKLDGK